jgi:hypothetical protein
MWFDLAMETALLGLALPQVLKQLKELLLRQGFLVQTMPTHNPVIVAYQEGNWFRTGKQLVLEISQIEQNVTRIDITAILDAKKDSRHAEELIEESFASSLYRSFKTLIEPRPYALGRN